MYNVKIQLVCIFLCFAGVLYSQNTTNTKVSNEEKTRIKQNFKDDAFYINDDGVVVYTRKDSKADSIKTTMPAQPTPLTAEKVLVKENNLISDTISSIIQHIASNDLVVDQSILDSSFTSTENTSAEPANPISFFTKSKEDVSSTIKEEITKIENEAPEVQVGYTVKDKSKVAITDEELEIISKPQSGSGYIVKEERETISRAAVEKIIAEKAEILIEEEKEDNTDIDTTPLSKKKTTYNSLEEANLAVDQLLVQLKREQKQINKPESKSNSLSSRVVNGYRPNPNKKEDSKKEASDYDVNETDNVDGQFGTDPTYYINGVMVDKAEVLKLRNKNILSRTIKVRNTASGNPNGEIWIEARNFQ